ncbi:hypothetical protein UlMin_045568 [Ulmus minor]
MQLNDQERVACASYMLKKGARHWWSTVKLTRDVNNMTWADFMEEFNQKYYNSAILRVQEDEFLNMKQGTMTVIDAVNKFEQLSRLCPSMIRTEEDKLRRIMDMLRPDITLAIESGGSPPRTVAKCVERAIRIEYRMAQVKEEKNKYYEAKRNQRKEGSESQNKNFNRGSKSNSKPNQSSNFKKKGKPSGQGGQGSQLEAPEPEAKIYAYTKGDVDAGTSNVVTGRQSQKMIISSMRARRMLSSGCQGFLATVVDTTCVEKSGPEGIAVVREFTDVFPEELPGLPPDREVSFEIDLIPGSAPVSKAPYRMAPAELKELQVQLQELLDKGIQGTQELDPELNRIREAVKNGTNTEFSLSSDGILNLRGRICIPNDEELRKQLLEEAHTTPYSVHPGATKMYKDMKQGFWWSGMKKDVADYVAKCLVCQKIKAEHQRPAGVLQPIEIPEWKWEQISMDFVVGLPKTTNGYDAVWVIVDRLTK